MHNIFDTIEDAARYVSHDGTVYEMGVLAGSGMYRLIDSIQKRGFKISSVFGFDNFDQGLPEEHPGIIPHSDWQPGVFKGTEEIGVATKEEVIEHIKNKIAPIFSPSNLHLIPGWFKDTLTFNTFRDYDMDLASFIHIDADLFISSYQALKFCFEMGIIGSDTVIRFDDILSTPTNAGQHLAITKITNEFAVEWDKLSLNCFKVYQYDLSQMVTNYD